MNHPCFTDSSLQHRCFTESPLLAGKGEEEVRRRNPISSPSLNLHVLVVLDLDVLIHAAGDCVLMKPAESSKLPYVAMVEKIEAGVRGQVKVRVRWYYRPEEPIGGRRQFHGSKELFLSDHYDVQSADTIEGKCVVHTFKSYTKLDTVGNEV
ncbi:hypothetical protein Syun_017087 [Stephania yunnanensis]|uniref:BAH domain-containing protein n=1 Tax=Stephania yunnanensis TaxID=152371 RepID=A0AAP0P4M1_9MAGN